MGAVRVVECYPFFDNPPRLEAVLDFFEIDSSCSKDRYSLSMKMLSRYLPRPSTETHIPASIIARQAICSKRAIGTACLTPGR
jgi:hypothetical protein